MSDFFGMSDKIFCECLNFFYRITENIFITTRISNSQLWLLAWILASQLPTLLSMDYSDVDRQTEFRFFSFRKYHDWGTVELWKWIKYGQKLRKNEENPCSNPFLDLGFGYPTTSLRWTERERVRIIGCFV